jgi:DNA-binding phage protein
MSNYRTIGEVEEQYLRDHPNEIDDYITILFDEYAESGDTASLLASLQVVSRVKGIGQIPEVSDLGQKGTLTENSNPPFSSVNAMIHAMGYRLIAQKLSESAHSHK